MLAEVVVSENASACIVAMAALEARTTVTPSCTGRRWTAAAIDRFRRPVRCGGRGGDGVGGTGATRWWWAVPGRGKASSAPRAHINSTRPARRSGFLGAKLLGFPTERRQGPPEHGRGARPLSVSSTTPSVVVSITQSTEWDAVPGRRGSRRSPRSSTATDAVHLDGVRLANGALGGVGRTVRVHGRRGVDVISFGGTKNGPTYGEAVVFLDAALACSALRAQAGDGVAVEDAVRLAEFAVV